MIIRRDRHVGVGGVVPGNQRLVGHADAVAGIGKVGIEAGLRAVFGNGVTGQNSPARTENGRPADDGNGDQGLRATRLAVGHDRIRRFARGGGGVGIALEIIIGPFAVGVDFPIIGCLLVAAGAVHGEIQVRKLVGGGEGRSVDQAADGVAVGSGVNADKISRVGSRRRPGHKDDVIHVKWSQLRLSLALNPKAIHVGLVGHPQGSQGDGDLLPVCCQRRERHGRLRGATERRPDLQRLSAFSPAVDPESQVGVRSRIKSGLMKVEGLEIRAEHANGVGKACQHGAGAA